jgi:uncharacterized membrane protein
VLTAAALYVHLACFAAYVGAGFAQLQIMRLSAKDGISADVRAAYERLAAVVTTKIEVPVAFGSLLSGMVFVMQNSALMKQGWLHGKLTCVVILLVVSHLEMFNARAIVRLREDGGKSADADIAARKKRHALLGRIGGIVVLVLLFLVTFVRLGVFASG